jgi:hypothetical protein
MATVVRISTQKTDLQLIAMAEDLMKDLKETHVVGLALVYVQADGGVVTDGMTAKSIYTLIGALERLKYTMLNDTGGELAD